jgi:hypothetical protein
MVNVGVGAVVDAGAGVNGAAAAAGAGVGSSLTSPCAIANPYSERRASTTAVSRRGLSPAS